MRKVFALAVLFLATTCLADNFRIDGTLTSPFTGGTVGVFTGWFGVNTRTGVITTWDVMMPSIPAGLNEPAADALTFTPSNSTFYFISGQGDIRTESQLFDLDFTIPNNTLIGFSGSAFSGGYGDLRSRPGFGYDASGTITPTAAPEPSSLFLMGSGLAGILTLRRKTFRAVVASCLSTGRKALL